jgi:HipA-like protein
MVLIWLSCSMTLKVMAMPNSAVASVFLGPRRVGTLGYLDGNTWFDYEDRDPEHPVLGQRFESDPGRRRTAIGRVPEWFANLLPESESGLRRLIGQELGRENPHDFQVITYIGEDLPGAVRVVTDSDLAGIPELAKSMEESRDYRIRFSLAGVQPKFSMRWEGKGLVLPMSGQGGDWIVKLPDRRFPSVPANEYAMLSWAKLAGIDVPEIKLLEASELSGLPQGLIMPDELAFAIRRFDRTAEGRVHQEDFAQVREVSPERKYERATYSGLGRIIQLVCPQDFTEYVRRLTAIVVMGNLDAHLKNWTLRYPDGRAARLSPAYDLVAVSAYEEFRGQHLSFAINGGRRSEAVSVENFRRFAMRVGVDADGVIAIVRKTVSNLVETWPEVRNKCPLPGFISAHIDDRIGNLPLVRF